MQYIGYVIEGDEGYPIAAGDTWEDCVALTFERIIAFYAHDLPALMCSSMQIQKHEALTHDEGVQFNIVIERWMQHENTQQI